MLQCIMPLPISQLPAALPRGGSRPAHPGPAHPLLLLSCAGLSRPPRPTPRPSELRGGLLDMPVQSRAQQGVTGMGGVRSLSAAPA